jgi:hypothetical protein
VEICALVPSSLAGLLVQARLLRYFLAHVLGLTIDGLGDMCHDALVTNGSRQRGDGRRWRLKRGDPAPLFGRASFSYKALRSRGLLRSVIFPELYPSIGYVGKELCSIVAIEIGLLPTPN